MHRARRLITALVLLLASARGALAAEGFEDYTPEPMAKQMYVPLFVIIAYAVIWVALAGFVFSVWRRQRRVADELERLRQDLAREEARR